VTILKIKVQFWEQIRIRPYAVNDSGFNNRIRIIADSDPWPCPDKTPSLTADNATSERSDHYIWAVLRIRIRDPLLFLPLDQGSGMWKKIPS
jgi:hypothetical protein